jgi:crossover junction endodeoxyribonuclease RuvC
MELFLGVDPGVSGALAVLDASSRILLLEDIPTCMRGKTRTHRIVDASGLSDLLKDFAHVRTAVVEQVGSMPGQGVSSAFSFGESFGVIRGVLGALAIPVDMVQPQKWKKFFGLTSDKELCRARAIDLFPTAPLHRKKDHGRAEALLMAKYAIEHSR